MAQENPYAKYRDMAQPVPVQQLQPIIGTVTPEEQERKRREEERQQQAADRAAASEQRAVAEFEGAGGKPTEAQGKVSVLLTRIKGGVQDIMSARSTSPDAQAPGMAETLAGGVLGEGIITRGIKGEDRRIVTDAQRDVLDALLTLGTGAAYNPEQFEAELLSHFPQYGDTPREIEIKNNRLRRLIESAKVQAGPKWGEIEEAISPFMANIGPEIKDPATEVTGQGETFLTPEDLELQEKLNAAYRAGASVGDLQAISAEYNRTFPIASQQDLDAARAEGRSLNVQPSGQRTEAQKLIGPVADSPVGALFVGASNALVSGGLDELAPIMGMDQAGVQAAKEMLRERYPVSSFAGEVAGATGQLAVGGAGLRAVGMGARGLAGAEIAQGAAYGAGESNDNRLGGAFVGAGGAVVGQQVAQRLLNPAAQKIVQRISAETGAPVEAVEQVIAEAVEGAGQKAPNVADDLAGPVLSSEAQTEVGTVARAAIGSGKSARDAQAKLAVMAQVDPEAKAAAERLGIELPVDVLSNDARLLTVTGLARSQIGSDAQQAWGQTVSQAIEKSDDTLRAIGATPDLAQVSDDIRARLLADMGGLEKQATALRTEVTDAINVQDRVDAQGLQAQLAQTINDLGGLDEAKQAFSAEEKKLLAMLGEGDVAKRPTYARLNQVRDQIGRAIFKNEGPWVDAPTATLKRYYGALADDQIAYIESVGGKELADKMRGSNDLYSQMFKARESMQTVFGKSLERDIGPLINRAITSGSKGDAQNLRKLVAAVPEDMRAQALLSGIFAQVDRGSAQGGFSFAKYATTYQGLRKNSPIYAEIAKTVGPEAERVLRDLYSISKRMAAAESKIVQTGASNQPLLNALNAEGLVSRMAKSATKRAVVTGGTAAAGGIGGGPVGAAMGAGLAEAMQQASTQGGKSNLDKLHGVLSSEPFKELVEKVGNGTVKPADINKTANSSKFVRYAKTVLGIKTFDGRKNWLQGAATAGATAQTRPEQQQTSTIEVR
jgi:hypothetical protein